MNVGKADDSSITIELQLCSHSSPEGGSFTSVASCGEINAGSFALRAPGKAAICFEVRKELGLLPALIGFLRDALERFPIFFDVLELTF
jgi:hypothetical protein